MSLRRVAIVGGARTPFVKSFTSYANYSNQDLMTFTLESLVKKFHLQGKVLGEVILGSVITHSSDWNLARECVLGTSLSPETPGCSLQKACGTSLEAVVQLANKISLGQIDVGIAGGTDTNSDAPIELKRGFSNRLVQSVKARDLLGRLLAWKGLGLKDIGLDFPGIMEPRTSLSMGVHCEKMAQEWHVSRGEQDILAALSHENASRALEAGFFEDLIYPFNGVKKDSFLRKETSVEKLKKLKPVFDTSARGTLTAGNSSPLTDGAAAVLLASEDYAKKNGLPILAYFRDAQSSAVAFHQGEGLLMAPTLAVSQLLQRNNLKLQDFDFYEIHEAFAAQVLCNLKAWESEKYCLERLKRESAMGALDRAKLNVKGSSLALGHPFAATGTRITATLGKIIKEKGQGRGLISICTAGGMGVAAILES